MMIDYLFLEISAKSMKGTLVHAWNAPRTVRIHYRRSIIIMKPNLFVTLLWALSWFCSILVPFTGFRCYLFLGRLCMSGKFIAKLGDVGLYGDESWRLNNRSSFLILRFGFACNVRASHWIIIMKAELRFKERYNRSGSKDGFHQISRKACEFILYKFYFTSNTYWFWSINSTLRRMNLWFRFSIVIEYNL